MKEADRFVVIEPNKKDDQPTMVIGVETKKTLEQSKSVVITKHFAYFLPLQDLSFLPPAPKGRLRIRSN